MARQLRADFGLPHVPFFLRVIINSEIYWKSLPYIEHLQTKHKIIICRIFDPTGDKKGGYSHNPVGKTPLGNRLYSILVSDCIKIGFILPSTSRINQCSCALFSSVWRGFQNFPYGCLGFGLPVIFPLFFFPYFFVSYSV